MSKSHWCLAAFAWAIAVPVVVAAEPVAVTVEEHQLLWAEDMQVFSRLLKSTLEEVYRSRAPTLLRLDSSDAVLAPAGPESKEARFDLLVRRATLSRAGGSDATVSEPLAVPLLGYGVVFHVTVPEPAAKSAAEPQSPTKADCPFLKLDRWQQARTRLELERNPQAHDCRRCHDASSDLDDVVPGTVTDSREVDGVWIDLGFPAVTSAPTTDDVLRAVMRLLAETGRHVRIPADQRVSVVLRFRPAIVEPKSGTAVGSDASEQTRGVEWVEADYPVPFRALASNPSTAGKDELAGDLHVKQGEFAKAVESYQAAYKAEIARLQQMHRAEMKGSDAAVVTVQQGIAKLLAKLVQAQVSAGDLDGARETLKKLEPYQKLSAAKTTEPSPPAARPFPRMVEIAVLKKDLDAVGDDLESLDFDQIRDFDPEAVRQAKLAKDADAARPPVQGVVLNVLGQIAEISVGIDDGVKLGQRAEAVPEGKQAPAATLEVVHVDRDKSVARVVSGEAKKGDSVLVRLPAER